MKKSVQKTSIHIPYSLPEKNKSAYYEQQWKIVSVKLLNQAYPRTVERKNIKILDFGCGRGEMLKILSENNYNCHGMDFDDECVRLSSRYAPCKKGVYKDLPEIYSSEFFDAVICLHVLEHMEDPKECVHFISKVSRKYIILAVPNLSNLSNLNFMRIRKCNRGHVCGWNFPHFENFITNICRLKVSQWGFDVVRLPPLPRKVDKAIHLSGIRKIIEEHLLLKLFPFLSNSIIAMCKKF